MANNWRKLLCNKNELQLLGTLNGGQSFRWKKLVKEGTEQWVGVFASKVWILEQKDDHILYKVHEHLADEPPNKKTKSVDYDTMLRNYFQLDLNLTEQYTKWSEADPNFKIAADQFYGIRILNQEPIENIFSFICSSNNNISRITSMVEKLATFYGPLICEIDDIKYYGFPNINALAVKGVEDKLKTNGFGYRANYISRSAQLILENGGDKWLRELEEMNYENAKKKLMTLTGIGAKVADCVCLMSLGHLEAIPVDTHVYQIAARVYMPKLTKQKTVTERIYNEIGDHFRNLYGPLAGWAHTVLFCADLKKFQINEDGTKSSKKLSKTGRRSKEIKLKT